ncbi:glutamate synthase central domain-containing protein [Cupriavidus basilensis]
MRPARFYVTEDDIVVLASEAGVLPFPESRIVQKWRLQPGKMFLIDMEQGRIIDDKELRGQPGQRQAAGQELDRRRAASSSTSSTPSPRTWPPRRSPTRACWIASKPSATPGRSVKFLMAPMALAGEEATGSMGNDSPLAVLSSKNKTPVPLLQATVRPGHPTRRSTRSSENMVMSLVSFIGPKPQPARAEQHQPADASRSVPARAGLQGHRQDPQHREHYTGGKSSVRTN